MLCRGKRSFSCHISETRQFREESQSTNKLDRCPDGYRTWCCGAVRVLSRQSCVTSTCRFQLGLSCVWCSCRERAEPDDSELLLFFQIWDHLMWERSVVVEEACLVRSKEHHTIPILIKTDTNSLTPQVSKQKAEP